MEDTLTAIEKLDKPYVTSCSVYVYRTDEDGNVLFLAK